MNPQKAQGAVSSGRTRGPDGAGTLRLDWPPQNVAEAMARAAIKRAMAGKIKDLCISLRPNPGTEQYRGMDITFSPRHGNTPDSSEAAAIVAEGVAAGAWAPLQWDEPSRPVRRHAHWSRLASLRRRLARVEKLLRGGRN
jgi:hypothetical protein